MAFGIKKKAVVEDNDEEKKLVSKVLKMYRDAYNDKSDKHSKWDDYYKAYTGEYFKKNLPAYKTQNIENFVFSTLETIKPVMLAENPRILALPQTEEMQGKSDAVQKSIDYEWQRTNFTRHLGNCITNALLYGTGIEGILWDAESDRIGNVAPVVISPFNFFIDPAATCLADAEYCIYATYKSIGEVLRLAPDKKEQLEKNKTSPSDNWLVHGKESTANMKDKLLYIEAYFRDHTQELSEVTEEDGNSYKVSKMKYPNGRRVIIAGDVLIIDGENIYQDGKFPFASLTCYDVPGEFWGMGEVEQIISPTNSVNILTNSIIETAELTSNPIWIMDKNCGVAQNSLTNRKGLVVRKNPGTEVRREQPPSLPAYIQNVIDILKKDIENISGVYDVTRGEKPTGITAAAAIQALSEQAQGRIKLKVQNMEFFLGEVGGLWLSRIQQFWVTKRSVRIMGEDLKPTFDLLCKDDIDGDFDIRIIAGSTMPVNKTSKLQMMIQLGQTMAEDGLPMIDRKSVLENADIINLDEVMQRFDQTKQQQAEQQKAQQDAQMQQMQMSQQFEMQKLQMEIQGKNNADMQQLKMQADVEKQKMQVQNQGEVESLKNQVQMASQQAAGESQLETQRSTDEVAKTAVPHSDVADLIANIPSDVVMKLAQSNPRFLEILNQVSNNQAQLKGQGLEGGK